MSEVIVITSGKGGVGKTAATVNIGAGLAAQGKRVVIIDTDLGLRNLDVAMGVENLVIYNLVDVIQERCQMKQALIRDRHYENLYLLPAAQSKDKSAVSAGQMQKLAEELKDDFDYVLIDSPPGIEKGFKNAIAGAEKAFIITTPDVAAVRDADRMNGLLKKNKIRTAHLIINRIRTDMIKRGDMMPVNDITDILPVPLLGVIPEDEQVIICTNRGVPVIDGGSSAGKAYDHICRRILGEAVPFPETEYDHGHSFLHRLTGLFHNL